jgi:hypothetical protein
MASHHNTIIVAWQRLLDIAPQVDQGEDMTRLAESLKDIEFLFLSPLNSVQFWILRGSRYDWYELRDDELDARKRIVFENLRRLCSDLPEPTIARDLLPPDHREFWHVTGRLHDRIRDACRTVEIGRTLTRACHVAYYVSDMRYF